MTALDSSPSRYTSQLLAFKLAEHPFLQRLTSDELRTGLASAIASKVLRLPAETSRDEVEDHVADIIESALNARHVSLQMAPTVLAEMRQLVGVSGAWHELCQKTLVDNKPSVPAIGAKESATSRLNEILEKHTPIRARFMAATQSFLDNAKSRGIVATTVNHVMSGFVATVGYSRAGRFLSSLNSASTVFGIRNLAAPPSQILHAAWTLSTNPIARDLLLLPSIVAMQDSLGRMRSMKLAGALRAFANFAEELPMKVATGVQLRSAEQMRSALASNLDAQIRRTGDPQIAEWFRPNFSGPDTRAVVLSVAAKRIHLDPAPEVVARKPTPSMSM